MSATVKVVQMEQWKQDAIETIEEMDVVDAINWIYELSGQHKGITEKNAKSFLTNMVSFGKNARSWADQIVYD